MKISQIISNIKQKNLINNIDSRYWVCDVLAEVCYSSEKTYRKVTVELFDRELKQKTELQSIIFKVNNTEYKCSTFRKISDYTWKCELSIPIEVDKIVLFIQSYGLMDGTVEYLNTNRYMQGLDYTEDEVLLNVCKDILHKENFVLAPYYNNMLWYCGCGRIHSIEKSQCACGMNLNEMQQFCKMNKAELVLKNAKSGLKVNLDENVNLTLKKYLNKLSAKYGVCTDDVLTLFSIEKLEEEQRTLIEQRCSEYLETNKLEMDIHKSFDDNIEDYAKKGSNGLLTPEYIKNKLDLEKLKNEYAEKKDVYEKELKKKAARIKKIVAGLAVCVAMIFLVFTVIDMIAPKAEGVAQLDTVENRADSFNANVFNYDNTGEYVNIFNGQSYSYTDGGRKMWDDLQNRFEKEGIYDVSSFLSKMKISPDVSHVNIDEATIPVAQSIGNKKLYAVSEDYFLVKEVTELEDNKERIDFYIGDKKGNRKYGDESDYVISELQNDLIVRQFIYKNNAVVAKRTYEYKGKKLQNSYYYELKAVGYDLDNSDNWNLVHTYFYEDNLVVEKQTKYDSYDEEERIYYKYRDKELISSERTYDSAYGLDEKVKIEYENGLQKHFTRTSYDQSTGEYYYDSNGLLCNLEIEQENVANLDKNIYRYVYDFDNGCMYILNFWLQDENYRINSISYNSFEEGLSSFIGTEKTATSVSTLFNMNFSENFITIFN